MRRLIADWEGSPIIRLVDPAGLRPYLSPAFTALSDFLSEHVPIQILQRRIERENLSPTGIILPQDCDIWLRDYHPLPLEADPHSASRYVAFRYAPQYLEREITSVVGLLAPNCDESDLILDVGNLIHNGQGTVIVTERALSDNCLSHAALHRELCKYFIVKELIVIPEEPGDITGHADGLVQFLSTSVIAVNRYDGETEEQRKYRLLLMQILRSHRLSVVLIDSEQPLSISGEGIPSAWGNRINFLRWREKILFPAFGNKRDIHTAEALERYGLLPVPVPIGLFELFTHYGGSLHCLTASFR